MQKADIERRRRGNKDILQLTDWAVFFLVFSYSSLLCVLSPDFTFLISQLSICSSRTRTSGLGLGLHEGLGNFGHGGSVGHTGGLDRTDSICISVEGGASTGTTAWV